MPVDEIRNVYKDVEDRHVIRTRDVYQQQNENGTDGYSETLLAVVANFCNSGIPEGCNAVGMAGKSKSGEVAVQLFAKVDLETMTIEQIGFKCRGCIAMTACASQICTMAFQKTFADAIKITPKDLENSLDGVPAKKRDTTDFAVEALHALMGDCMIRQGKTLDEIDKVIPCDQSSVACLLCEHCSLRDQRADILYGDAK
ncbi:MAG: iron-sulfur cluster assembly scaffold protein [Eggerthellaceae bacterium]|jgi:NifU-like protein involved in Fe-S cluster formation|nr:iron-sulfur cluster assembly scaffold protein [Eggerthellaceae bacterium]MCH4220971.1 iron-sulfur cluster assembly scaffold protein [Eggerthellaceae bacterium]